jgi:hypothetical protein
MLIRMCVCVLALRRLVIWWVATLCHAILSSTGDLFSHSNRRCGHMSLSFLLHSVKFGLVCVCGQIKLVLWLPMYCTNLNFSV